MKKIILLLAFLFLSCKPSVNPSDVAFLNGYWQIQQVTLPDGTVKEYPVNQTVDFFDVQNHTGYRKKVVPQPNGKFETSNIQEDITVVPTDTGLFIQYKTPYAHWKEEITEISKEKLILKNQHNFIYQYSRLNP